MRRGGTFMQHVYIVGAKGVSFYGGYESFVQKLLEYHKDNTELKYHVACKANGDGHMDVTKLIGASEIINQRFIYNNADCFLVTVPDKIGPAQALIYDIRALQECSKHILANNIEHPIVYILACRIGPFADKYVKMIHRLGGKVYLNPDGQEWKREKWSRPVRMYWKKSEHMMIKHADLVICDSKNIEKYIQESYKQYNPKTTYIAYGAETKKSALQDNDPKFVEWLNAHGLENRKYYTAIGRCVPENNYETMIREFMSTQTDKDFVIITTENPKMLNELDEKLHYRQDKRVKFVGTVYDTELLTKIRENSYGYIHGHSVGGTNPSLLEALGATKLNLLFDIGFNREVAEDAALYWNKNNGNLAALINKVDSLSENTIISLEKKAKKRIHDAYSWSHICDMYEKIFVERG